MPLKLLVLSFYYPPDLSAGSFRIKALIEQLQAIHEKSIEIEVITTLPNRYATWHVDAPLFEEHNGLSITRIPLPAHQSGILDQARAFSVYAKAASQKAQQKDYDLVYATSSRLMTAVLGTWIARRQKIPLYLDIRDIFVDTIGDVLPSKAALLAKPVFSTLERWSFSRASRINLVSKGFESYFTQRYPKIPLRWFSNGIDEEFIEAGKSLPGKKKQEGVLTILYAGNIGEGQGLHTIIPPLAKKLEGRARFRIIGDGGRVEQLRQNLAAQGCTQVDMIAPMTRQELIHEYQQADVLFLHLNNYPAFEKVLPSKLFEYAALGKPIWAGLSGYPGLFVRNEIEGAAVFHPCDVQGAIEALDTLDLASGARGNFIAKYNRHDIMKSMAHDICELG